MYFRCKNYNKYYASNFCGIIPIYIFCGLRTLFDALLFLELDAARTQYLSKQI